MIDRRFTEVMRPADGPMDLNTGRPNAKDAFFTGGFTLASLAISAVGAVLAAWSIPTEYGASKLWYVLTCFGGIVTVFGLIYSWRMFDATIVEWQAYQVRKNQWHEVQLAAYRNFKGVEVTRTYSETELSPKMASHVLLAGLAVHFRVQQSYGRSVPYSVRSLDDKLYIGNDANRTIFLGELKGTSPEQMSKLFSQIGWVKDRRNGASGSWVPQSTDELIETFIRNWASIKNKVEYNEN